MWILTRELLTNFCKSAYIREFLLLFAKLGEFNKKNHKFTAVLKGLQ